MSRTSFQLTSKVWIVVFVSLIITLFLATVTNLILGSVYIPISKILRFFFSGTTHNTTWDLILLNVRLPKMLTAVFVGGALGISGLQMQTLFKNPLAGPYVLGISSGAGLGVALAIFLGLSLGSFLELSGLGRSWLLVICAGLGAFGVLIVITLASRRTRDSVTLLIIGLMFGATSSAIVSILQYFSQAENIQAYVIWSFGNLGSLSWTELKIFIPLILIGFLISIFLSKPLNALLLGENYAQSMGVNLKFNRLLIIITTSILAGTVTAFCGPIAFLGIALPHIGRMIFRTSNHLYLTPIIILTGAILMLIFDTISQLPFSEATLPINAITSLFGAPFVIYLILRQKTMAQSFES